MSPYWIALIVLAGILLVFFILLSIIKKAKKAKMSPYEEALISLIEGDEKHALKKFQEAVFENSDNIEAYIRLAELLRKRKEPLKALQIHTYLLARRGIKKNTINRILFQMAKDYLSLEAYQKATDTLRKLIKSEPHNEKYYSLLLLNFERSSFWQDAIETYRKMTKLFKYSFDKLTAYEAQAAYESYKKGNADFALKVLARILKANPENIPALIYSGDIQYSQGNTEDAIKQYEKLIESNPGKAHIAFRHLTKAYFDKGEYQKIEATYKTILETIPDDSKTISDLAEFYLKMGRFNEAHELLRNAIETNSNSLMMNLLLLLTEMEESKSESTQILRRIVDTLKQKELYICSECGAQSQTFIIRCPDCGALETFSLEVTA